MKLQSLILIMVILAGIVAPANLSFCAVHDGKVALGTLDVCSHTSPAVSTGGEMPCVHTTINDITPVEWAFTLPTDSPVFSLSLFTADNEQPPRS